MSGAREALYGAGRLAFGAALIGAPGGFGRVLAGDDAREPAVQVALRAYGTRDVVLGLGTLHAVAGGGDVAPWLRAGVASDLLDTAVQVVDWPHLPPDKRLPGVVAAVTSAAVGIALLVRE